MCAQHHACSNPIPARNQKSFIEEKGSCRELSTASCRRCLTPSNFHESCERRRKGRMGQMVAVDWPTLLRIQCRLLTIRCPAPLPQFLVSNEQMDVQMDL